MLFKTQPASAGLNIIIVGCGKVGSTLVERLTGEGHDVTIIDENAERIQELADYYDVMGIVGNGASHSIQEEAGIQNAHLFIAVTESDELNLLCCIIAKQDGDCSTIARIRTPDYIKDSAYLREKLGCWSARWRSWIAKWRRRPTSRGCARTSACRNSTSKTTIWT